MIPQRMLSPPTCNNSNNGIILLCVLLLFLDDVNAFSASRSSSRQQTNHYKNQKCNNEGIEVKSVPKVDAVDFDPWIHYFHSHKEDDVVVLDNDKKNNNNNDNNNANTYETPVLIENVLSVEACDKICDTLVECVGGSDDDDDDGDDNKYVDMQRQQKQSDDDDDGLPITPKTDIYQVTLNEAFEYMMESKADDSFFCFCEGLLDDPSDSKLSKIRQILSLAKERLFSNNNNVQISSSNNNNNDNDNVNDGNENNDLFQYFPDDVKPTDCIVLAGEGATSTLHRDPFEWTGTSLCLEGTKLWRFIAPPGLHNPATIDSGVQTIDDVLNSYRLASVAWDDNNNNHPTSNTLTSISQPLPLSAGWQSDYSLYAFRDGNKVLSARELASIEEELGDKQKHSILESIATDLEALRPNLPDHFYQNNNNHHTNNNKSSIWTVIQKPGDLLVIPAHWWHQTYALEPSLAIASQRCGSERDFERVMRHMLTTSGSCTTTTTNTHSTIQSQIMQGLLDDENNSDDNHDHSRNVVNKLFRHLSSFRKEKNTT